MSYYLNKIVDGCVNPFIIGLVLLVAAFLLIARGRRRWGWGLFAAGLAWFWFWTTPIVADTFCHAFERGFPPQRAETLPQADAIVLLGGGVSVNTNTCPYPELYAAADRVWHAARLYRAGRAPLVIPTGGGAEIAERPLLADLGVPREAILCEDAARNTEENARLVNDLLRARHKNAPGRTKVLLVTSALHMRRAKFLFERYAPDLEIIPAACDHEATLSATREKSPGDFLPHAHALLPVSYAFKEMIAYWGYRLLRR